ncbi:MAG TPA: class I SAM-dependent methyltransferase [Thermoanaerobaculia bacterium]|nr:class I SAM-dependent methyltransferase [Thermoanaerobaculia bacterium]
MAIQTRWDDGKFTAHLELLVWTSSPVVRRYLHALVSGDPNCDWLTWVEAAHLQPKLDRALVLGCGSGWLERALAQRGRFRSIVACDFAADTVSRAHGTAEDEGISSIEYAVLDLENEKLPAGPFDAIIANDVLHHITGLEPLYTRIHDALAPGGRLVFNEYVGPNRFQYSDAHLETVNRYLRLLPNRLRWDPIGGRLLWKRERVDPKQLVIDDPTEAVRSEDVLPLARRFFKAEKEYVYGGGLLNPLLFGIVTNFRAGDPWDDMLMSRLCAAEQRLTEAGEIEPDFRIFVGSRRDDRSDSDSG